MFSKNAPDETESDHASARTGFVAKLGEIVIWRSQAATHLHHLAVSRSLATKPPNPPVNTRRREGQLPASAISGPFLASFRNRTSLFSTSPVANESHHSTPENHPISGLLTPPDGPNSPLYGSSRHTRVNPWQFGIGRLSTQYAYTLLTPGGCCDT